jgi:hypothetical protein
VIEPTDLPKQVKDGVLKTTLNPPTFSREDSAERAHIWLRAKEAQEAGDEILARVLLKAYGEIDNSTPSGGTKPSVIRSVSANPVMVSTATSPTEIKEEEDLIYAVGTVTSHQDIGFTPYFEENIRKLKAPLPLTIFDKGTSVTLRMLNSTQYEHVLTGCFYDLNRMAETSLNHTPNGQASQIFRR